MKNEKCHYKSPIGWIEIEAENNVITKLSFCKTPLSPILNPDNNILQQCCSELDEYFSGKRKIFNVKTSVKGTDFQQTVWQELTKIPYGKAISYGDLARAINRPKAYRAAGSANGKNPIAIIIPCHRVIASGGGLGGYAYGLDIKKQLLDIENVNIGKQ